MYLIASMYRYGYYGFDWTYILVLIGAVLCMAASAMVNSAYSRYSKVRTSSGITGAEAARQILRANGIYDVTVQHVSGSLTDHYDPRTKVVNLSDAVYNASSVAAVGVAAHECGHAMQDAESYTFLRFRTALVPVANIGSNLAWPLIIIGLIIGGSGSSILLQAGIWMFSLAVLFQIVTLPVEFNASSRAMKQIRSLGLLTGDEASQSAKVLRAAALTYVAAAASSILQLLRIILIAGGRNRRD